MYSKQLFCERLKTARMEKKLTQAELGNMFSVPRQYISRWEKGEQEPTLTRTYDLAVALEVSVDYLLGLTDKSEINK